MPPTTRTVRSGTYRAHPYGTRASMLTHTPGSRNSENHVRVVRLDQLANPARFETMGGSGRITVMPDGVNVAQAGGWVEYDRIINGQRQGVDAVVTLNMLRTGSTPTYSFPFMTRRTGLMIVRGHLLARVLGGDGADPRNLVPLYHLRNNLPMYRDFEGRVQRYVERGNNVRVTITPQYATGAGVAPGLTVFPTAIRYEATDAVTGARVLPGGFIQFSTGFHPGR